MDYIFALTCILGSFYMALKNREIISGILLGLAIGFRMTSGAMVVPILILFYGHCQGFSKYYFQKASRLAGSMLIVIIVVYSPVFLTCGANFFTFIDRYPRLLSIMAKATVGVWGWIGSLGIIMALGWGCLNRRRVREISRKHQYLVLSSLSVILLYAIAYLRLPHDAAYLLPVVPVTILLLDRYLPKSLSKIICFLIISSSCIYVKNVEAISTIQYGSILGDRKVRIANHELAAQTVDFATQLDRESLIVAGWHFPQIQVYLGEHKIDDIQVTYLLTPNQIKNSVPAQKNLYYIPSIREYNQEVYGIDLHDYGSKQVPLQAEVIANER